MSVDTLIGNSPANRVCGHNTDSCNGGLGVDTATTGETVLGVP